MTKRLWGRLCVLTLALALLLPLGACGGSFQKKNKTSIKIGVTVYDQYDTFIAQMLDAIEAEAKKLEGENGISVFLETRNASGSQREQNNQVEDFLNSGCDVICVNLVDRTDPTVIIDKAKSANVPVIFFNRELVAEDLERWNKLYYVGAVALESGIMQGEMVVESYRQQPERLDKNGDGVLQYVMLEGEAGHQDAIIRTEYSVNTIQASGIHVEKLAHAIANWNRGQAQTKMKQWLDSYGDRIELVLSNNDDMALGSIDAYRDAGVRQEEYPHIYGIDGTRPGLEAIRSGLLSGTVYNDGAGQAREMMRLAYDLAMQLPTDNVADMSGNYVRLPHRKIRPEDAETALEGR